MIENGQHTTHTKIMVRWLMWNYRKMFLNNQSLHFQSVKYGHRNSCLQFDSIFVVQHRTRKVCRLEVTCRTNTNNTDFFDMVHFWDERFLSMCTLTQETTTGRTTWMCSFPCPNKRIRGCATSYAPICRTYQGELVVHGLLPAPDMVVTDWTGPFCLDQIRCTEVLKYRHLLHLSQIRSGSSKEQTSICNGWWIRCNRGPKKRNLLEPIDRKTWFWRVWNHYILCIGHLK